MLRDMLVRLLVQVVLGGALASAIVCPLHLSTGPAFVVGLVCGYVVRPVAEWIAG